MDSHSTPLVGVHLGIDRPRVSSHTCLKLCGSWVSVLADERGLGLLARSGGQASVCRAEKEPTSSPSFCPCFALRLCINHLTPRQKELKEGGASLAHNLKV